MNIAIVGAGNVAWHLAKALQKAGHSITAVYSRTQEQTEELAGQLENTKAILTPDFRELHVDVVLLAVPDAALEEVAEQLQVKQGTIVAHTSGSQPMQKLQSIKGAATGVFYPLQTFSKNAPVDINQVPILIEADSRETIDKLKLLAQSISLQVEEVTSEKRKSIHLAAVFACNFTNHLLGISYTLLEQADLPTNLLQPLIRETINKASNYNPFTVQTGPAVRHDQNVIEEHMQLLSTHPQFKQLYQLLTQSIQQQQTPEK